MQECTDKIQVPGLYYTLLVVDNKKYIVPNWVEVPMDTTFDDVELISPFTNKLFEPKPEKQVDEIIKVEVPSSTGKGSYIVEKNAAGHWTCTCPVNLYRRMECKHMKQVKLNTYK